MTSTPGRLGAGHLRTLFASTALLLGISDRSQAALPQPLPFAQTVAAPRDQAFDGEIALEVDATDIAHRIFRVRETIPVQAGSSVTLLYPAWEPSSHARTIASANLAGLVIHAGSTRLPWRRDAVDMHAFHVDVPAGVDRIDLAFQYVTRIDEAVMRPDMVVVQWQRLLLYPAGWFARNIPVRAQVRLPAGLKAFSSLDAARTDALGIALEPVSLEMLTDSPLIAARHTHSVDLNPAGTSRFRLHLLADAPADLPLADHDLRGLRRLAAQTSALLGPAPYRRFDAMVVLSDTLASGGTEHAASAEIMLPAGFFRAPRAQLNNLDLIAHEHVHAWNGRAHQPADLWAPTLNVPIRNSLLWVYEGQTEFWGRVLAARSGIRDRQQTLDRLALDAAEVAGMDGRAWKTLRDTNHDPLHVSGRSTPWPDWQRRKDYYLEGVLLWLDVDMILRTHSGDRVGLDDFASRFFRPTAHGEVRTYTFDDVCTTLAALVPLDWAAYLDARLDATDAGVLQGLERAGWALAFTDSPSATFLQHEQELGGRDLRYAIGMVVGDQGRVRAVAWDGPAFRGGLAPGATLLRVNGADFTPDALLAAVAASTRVPLSLQYEVDGIRTTVVLDYRGGLRYPHLRRIAGRQDRLSALLAPRRVPDEASRASRP